MSICKYYYVYAHFDKEGKCFYIGKGKNKRAFSHRGRNKYWTREAARGLKFMYLEEGKDGR